MIKKYVNSIWSSSLALKNLNSFITRFSSVSRLAFISINPRKEEIETLDVRGVLNEFAHAIARKQLNDSFRILQSSRPKKEVGSNSASP